MYRAKIRERRSKHPVHKQKHAKYGMVFPAPNQVFGKPSRGKKITTQYDNSKMQDLMRRNTLLGFWNLRRIGAVLFNQVGNQKWAKAWTRLFGVQARVPAELKKGEKALAQGIFCDGNIVTVIRDKGSWCQLAPGQAQLTEVVVGTNSMYYRNIYWWVYPDAKTKEIWIEKSMMEKL